LGFSLVGFTTFHFQGFPFFRHFGTFIFTKTILQVVSKPLEFLLP